MWYLLTQRCEFKYRSEPRSCWTRLVITWWKLAGIFTWRWVATMQPALSGPPGYHYVHEHLWLDWLIRRSCMLDPISVFLRSIVALLDSYQIGILTFTSHKMYVAYNMPEVLRFSRARVIWKRTGSPGCSRTRRKCFARKLTSISSVPLRRPVMRSVLLFLDPLFIIKYWKYHVQDSVWCDGIMLIWKFVFGKRSMQIEFYRY